jgi:hypothetical protein
MSRRSTLSCAKMISEPMVRLAQTMHPSCVEINTTFKQIETIFHLIYATKGYHLVCPKRFKNLWYIWCKPCTYLASRLILIQTDRNELPLDQCHLEVPSGVPRKIFMSVVHSAQTVHQYFVKVNTISKGSKTSFHLTNVT